MSNQQLDGESSEQNVAVEEAKPEEFPKRSSAAESGTFTEEDLSEEEEDVSEDGQVEVVTKPAAKASEDSVLRRETESPTDLKRVKWEEVDLLFLKTDLGTPFRYAPTFKAQSSYENGVAYLDFAFIQGHINKRLYDRLSEKYQFFHRAYQNKMRFIKELANDNAIYRATLVDHRKIEDWFESMPETMDGKAEVAAADGEKQELHDIRKERLNAIAYRLILTDLCERGDKWSKEVQRTANDRDFLASEIERLSPDKGAMSGSKQAVANLLLDIYALEEELAEIVGKIKAVDDFTHGFVARNQVLETKLEALEMKHGADNKELTDLRLENDRNMKARTELRAKAAENERALDELNQQKQAFSRQFEKLQFESSKENRKAKLITKKVDATNTETQLWDVRVLRLKERMDKSRATMDELNKSIENAEKELKGMEKEVLRGRGVLERLGNKERLLGKAVAAMRSENEGEKTKINALKETCKAKEDPAVLANERRKLEKEIGALRREIIESSRLQGLERQEYVRVYGEIKQLQQAQWSLRKTFQDNIGKIRKANLEQMHEIDNIRRLLLEIEKQKNNIRWVMQQKLADEKLLAKKNAELGKVQVRYGNERLEKSKDLQEQTLRLQSISEWKEINRVGDSEKEELTSFKMQLVAKREDVHKETSVTRDVIRESEISLKATKAELNRCKIEYEAREKGNHKIKFELYKKQLENERVIQQFTEAATERNYKSMKLNDTLREQICYHEHISTTEEMIRRADWELVTRMDVITRLESIKKMEMLGMDKTREKLEMWHGMLDNLDDLSRRFEEVTTRQIELQKQFQGSRHRMVREKQKEDPKEVKRKLEVLENRVSVQEEKVIELKLLNNQTSKLLDNLQRSREEKLEMAEASNNAFVDSMRKNINAEKKTKQIAVDLSLKKSLAESLKQELEQAKKAYREAVARFQRGEPPTQEMEAEWTRNTKKIGDDRRKVTGPTRVPVSTLHQAITLLKC